MKYLTIERLFRVLLYSWFGGVLSTFFTPKYQDSPGLSWPNWLGMLLGAMLGIWFVYLDWKKEKKEKKLEPPPKIIPPDIKASEAVIGDTYRVTQLPILWEDDHLMKVGDLVLRTDKGFWCWRWKKTVRADNDNLRLKPWLQKEVS